MTSVAKAYARRKYSEDEERDDRGRWSAGGDGSEGTYTPTQQPSDEQAEANWVNSLTSGERSAFLGYGTSEYHAINSYLRGGEAKLVSDFERNQGYTPVGHGTTDDPKVMVATAKAEIAKMEHAFSTAPPLTEDRTVYRGMHVTEQPVVGATFTDKGFVSTSSHADSAEEFAGYLAEYGRAPSEIGLVEITVPAGTQAVDMQTVWKESTGSSAFDATEAETLINHGATFTITSVEDVPGSYYKIKATLT